jgi:RNA polymerase sigma-70 factor (ECF subfamily)
MAPSLMRSFGAAALYNALVSDTKRARFEAEVLVHARAVYGAACRLARVEDDARDLTQETMLRAYRTFDGFAPGTNARAWLLTILYSVFVNRYRRERRRPAHVSIDDLEVGYARELAAPETPVADPFIGPWTEPEVAAAVAELPEAFRGAIMLVDVEGLTYEEAAVALECAVGTVRSRLFRARRVLAAALRHVARRRGLVTERAE